MAKRDIEGCLGVYQQRERDELDAHDKNYDDRPDEKPASGTASCPPPVSDPLVARPARRAQVSHSDSRRNLNDSGQSNGLCSQVVDIDGTSTLDRIQMVGY